METIIVNTRTNSKYGLVNPDDELTVGKDIDKAGAERWCKNGIARRGDLKKKMTPDSSNTIPEIKEYLDSKGIEYDSTDRKADLLDKCT